MIKYEHKDITTVTRGIIGHGVNCQGAMGSGVALAIKTKWPDIYDSYMKFFNHFVEVNLKEQERKGTPINEIKFRSERLLGAVDTCVVGDGIVVVNCFTQNFFGADGVYKTSKYADPTAIGLCVEKLNIIANLYNIEEIYIPKIGSALGGLDWETEVEPVIEATGVDLTVCVWP
jgi:hypothetical protein